MPRRPTPKRRTHPDGTTTVAGKAANGDGSLYPLAAGGWVATYYDRTGKRREARGRTQALAVANRERREAEDLNTGHAAFGPSITVSELACWWLDNVAAGQVRASSLAKYRERVARITPGLGVVRVTDLRAEQVAGLLAELSRNGLAPSTVRDVHTILKLVLNQAVDLGLVPASVAARVKAPTVSRKPGRALTVADTRMLLDAARDARYGAAVNLLFTSGWRVSEVLGLAWSDVDWQAATATVRRAATFTNGPGGRLGPTKTTGQLGVHRLTAGTVDALRRRKAAQAAERLAAGPVWQTHTFEARPVELVFTTLDGAVLHRQVIARAISVCAVAAGLDPTGLGTHSGRRSLVTSLYGAEGVDLADIARLVGHASTATTARYVASLGARPERTAAAVAQMFD